MKVSIRGKLVVIHQKQCILYISVKARRENPEQASKVGTHTQYKIYLLALSMTM